MHRRATRPYSAATQPTSLICPVCIDSPLYPSRWKLWERFVVPLTIFRPYRCRRCGWRGWRRPPRDRR